MKRSIAIDMDGVLADVETQFIAWYEREYHIRIPKESMTGIPEAEAFPDKGATRRYIQTPNFFRSLSVIDGAVDAVQRLMVKYDVYIASAAMEFPLSLPEKYSWLQEHFPFISWRHIIFCGDKSIINTDFIIDDHAKNLDNFKGKTLLFSCGHNANITNHQRVNNWEEVLEFLDA